MADSKDTPTIKLDDKTNVRKHLSELKAGGRIKIERGGYVITVGIPLGLSPSSDSKTENETKNTSNWFE